MLRAAAMDPGVVPGRTWHIEGGKMPEKYDKISKEKKVHYN
jgi:hypothetical protein